MKTVLRFLKDERGTETVEWAVIIGIIATGAIAAATLIGPKVTSIFNNLESQLPAAK
jgi:Flp pilus assembly pilin Flp